MYTRMYIQPWYACTRAIDYFFSLWIPFIFQDEDGSNAVSMEELETFGFIFNISRRASKMIFRDFDVDDSKELDFQEFRMFTLACIDKQQDIDEQEDGHSYLFCIMPLKNDQVALWSYDVPASVIF